MMNILKRLLFASSIVGVMVADPSAYAAVLTVVGQDPSFVTAGWDNANKADTVETNTPGMLKVRGNSPNFLHKAYFQFDLSALPSGATILGATLQIQSNGGNNDNINLFGIVDGSPNEVYSANSLTYNNAPGHFPEIRNTAGSFVSDNIGMNLATALSLGNLGPSSISIVQPGNRYLYKISGSALTSFLNDDNNQTITVALTPNVGDGARFFFVPGSSGDETILTLNWAILPEPGTMGLLAMAFGLLGLWKRHRGIGN